MFSRDFFQTHRVYCSVLNDGQLSLNDAAYTNLYFSSNISLTSRLDTFDPKYYSPEIESLALAQQSN